MALLFMFGYAANAQMSYEEFHAKYVPTYEKLAPDYNAVQVVNESDPETGGLVMLLLMQQAEEGDEDSKLKIVAILTSCDREVVAAFLKEMNHDDAVNCLNYINFEWQREVMYFVDKTTYHNLAPYLFSMILYTGPTGPFGPEIDNWSPAYAGIGFDAGWSGMKGYNNVIENYGEFTELHWLKGLNVNFGIRTKKHNFIDITYENRSAKTKYENTSFSNNNYSQHTIGVNMLKGKGRDGAMFVFTKGFGFQANFASWKLTNTAGKTKIGKGINGGISYNLQLFINPLKDIPLMFGMRAYAQLNLPKYNFNDLYDTLYNIAGPSDIGDNKSGIASFGFQFQAMYKFGKKKDERVFTDFDTELAKSVDNGVNTSYSEILPIISPDGKTLYFIRADHPYNNQGSLNSQDLWISDITNGVDGATAERMKDPFNTMRYNSIAGVSPDGNTMMIKGVFDSKGEYVKRGYSMIYKTKEGWSDPEECVIPDYDDMTKGDYVGAYWTQDGKHIIMSFSEDEDDNEQDLYVTHLQEDGTWTSPVPLGSTVNTDGDEHSPFLASDGKTLYYSSDREGGLGSQDIWMVKREDDSWTKWSEPVNLGDEINTDDWDAYYTLDAQGQYAYMASSKDSKGREDIVRIKLHEDVQPDPVVLITGTVYNQKTNEPIVATISYNGLSDGKNYGVARTDPATGEYTIILPYGINYDFSASAEGFIGVSDNLDLTGIGEYEEITRDLYLVPIEVGATVRLNNIFFETGKSELKTESFVELDRVVQFLNDNPKVIIELSGHTDNVGNKESNKSLSQKRADAVMQYLVSKGIDPSRLVAKGYGMEKPVADNSTEEGKAQNRRVEFTILEN